MTHDYLIRSIEPRDNAAMAAIIHTVMPEFGAGPWLCGERFSAADIWLYVWLDFGAGVNQPFDRTLPKIGPWFERMAARPSAAASRALLATA